MAQGGATMNDLIRRAAGRRTAAEDEEAQGPDAVFDELLALQERDQAAWGKLSPAVRAALANYATVKSVIAEQEEGEQ